MGRRAILHKYFKYHTTIAILTCFEAYTKKFRFQTHKSSMFWKEVLSKSKLVWKILQWYTSIHTTNLQQFLVIFVLKLIFIVAFWNKTCRIFDVKGIICCWVWWITQRCPLFSKMQRLTIFYYRNPWLEVFIQELKLNSNSHFTLQNIQTENLM